MNITIDQMVEHLCEDYDPDKSFMMAVYNENGDPVVAMPFPVTDEELHDLKTLLVALTIPIMQVERGDLTEEEIRDKVEKIGSDEFIDRVLH